MLRSNDVRTFLMFAIVYVAMIVMLFLDDSADPLVADRSPDQDSTWAAPEAVLNPGLPSTAHSVAFRPADQSAKRP